GPEPARLQGLLVGPLGRLGRTLLLLGEIIDAGTVLRADVVSLTHALGRVVRLEEDLEKLLVADLRRIVNEEHSLVMPGHARANLFVSRVRRAPAGIADGGDVDARPLPELPLGAPEAAKPEQRLLGALRVGSLQRRAGHEMRRCGRDGIGAAGQGLVGRGYG